MKCNINTRNTLLPATTLDTMSQIRVLNGFLRENTIYNKYILLIL